MSASYECTAADNSAGLLLCAFNGTVRANCTRDADCPGNGAFCYQNAEWSAVPSQCACYVVFGIQGANCDEMGGVRAHGLYVTNAIFLLICAWVLVQSVRAACLLRVWRFNSENTHHATTLMLIVSAVFGLASGAVQIAIMDGTYQFETRPDGTRQEPMQDAGNYLFTIWFTATSYAALNVSITWLFLSVMAERNNKRVAILYRRWLMAYYVIFLIALIVIYALGHFDYYAIISVPAVLYLAVVYMYAYLRIQKTLKRSIALTANKTTGGRGEVEGEEEGDSGRNTSMRNLMRQVARTALIMSLLAIANILIVIIGEYGILDTPEYPASYLTLRFAYITGAVLTWALADYTLNFAKSTAVKSHRHQQEGIGGDGEATTSKQQQHKPPGGDFTLSSTTHLPREATAVNAPATTTTSPSRVKIDELDRDV